MKTESISLSEPSMTDKPIQEMTLSMQLSAVLERQYLEYFDLDVWNIAPIDNFKAVNVPILREVEALSPVSNIDEFSKEVPYMLAGCRKKGQKFVFTIHGQKGKKAIYLGGCRVTGKANESTIDYLYNIESTFKSYNNGLRMSAPARLEDDKKLEILNDFIQNASSGAVITGIPSGRNGFFSLKSQGLDRLIRVITDKEYVLNVIAEPVDSIEVQATIDKFRQLRSEIHSLVKRNISKSNTTSTTKSHSHRDSESNKGLNLPKLLSRTGLFLQATRLVTAKLAPVANVLFMLGNMLNVNGHDSSISNISDSESNTSGMTWEALDSNIEACEKLLMQHINRLEYAKSTGWWDVCTYVLAEDNRTLNSITGILKSIFSGEHSLLDPIREIRIPSFLIKEGILKGQKIKVVPKFLDSPENPLGKIHNSLSTFLTSEELAVCCHLPIQEIPGISLKNQVEFSLNVPSFSENTINLGKIVDNRNTPIRNLEVPLKKLCEHILVTGKPGMGKTNTCMQILAESYLNHNIPFLVIEPAKTEYRELQKLEKLRNSLNIFSIVDSQMLPFRINPFELMHGVSLSFHIEMLKAVFEASFYLHAGMNFILEEALYGVYKDLGWSIQTSENYFFDVNSKEERRKKKALYTPTLTMFHDKLNEVLSNKGYGKDIEKDMGAALRSRINSITLGSKGLVLNNQKGIPFEDLMNSPTIIELSGFGNKQDKALIMAILLGFLYEYAEVRQKSLTSDQYETLQHLTLIEEAHQLLKNSSTNNKELGDPQSKAIDTFVDMLAELRAFGEGLIIADQTPTDLAIGVLKNTNLKITHRLSFPNDRKITGDSMGLTEKQIDYISDLEQGFSIVHDESLKNAVLAQITNFKKGLTKEKPASFNANYPKNYLRKDDSCKKCKLPCQFFSLYEDISGRIAAEFLQQEKYNTKQKEILPKLFWYNFLHNIKMFDKTQGAEMTILFEKEWTKWNGKFMSYTKNIDTETYVGLLYCASTQRLKIDLHHLLSLNKIPVITNLEHISKLCLIFGEIVYQKLTSKVESSTILKFHEELTSLLKIHFPL